MKCITESPSEDALIAWAKAVEILGEDKEWACQDTDWHGEPFDLDAGLAFLEKAAQGGVLEAKLRLARWLIHSDDSDYDKALEILRESVDCGCPAAADYLGELLFSDEYGLRDDRGPHYYLEIAANAGFPYAQCRLGYDYAVGIPGVLQDKEKALSWFKKADGGVYRPTYAMRVMSDVRQGVDVSTAAEKWLHELLRVVGPNETFVKAMSSDVAGGGANLKNPRHRIVLCDRNCPAMCCGLAHKDADSEQTAHE